MNLPKFNYPKLFSIFIFLFLLWPSRFAVFYYENIPGDEIFDNLIKKTSKNVSTFRDKGIHCDYTELLDENHFFYKKPFAMSDVINIAEIRQGGEFWPEECNPSFSTAVIIPYRNRAAQLKQFLGYIHNFLRKQNIHYKIFVIEQNGSDSENNSFNRAKLFNIGAEYAIRENFPCLVMQDVDLMPLNLGNIYACTLRPRHMSASVDTFRYNLPYYGLFGGAIAILTEQFVKVNGFSNMYQGWGGEDDDMYARLVNKNYKIIRFHPSYAQYSMLKHKREKPSESRHDKLSTAHLRYETDGFKSLVYCEISKEKNSLYTNVLVEIYPNSTCKEKF